MNTEEIIKLAREAGGYDGFTSPPTNWDDGNFVISPEQLSKFATFVRNAALKEAIKVIEEYRIPVGNSPAGELACDWTRNALVDIRDAIWELKGKP